MSLDNKLNIELINTLSKENETLHNIITDQTKLITMLEQELYDLQNKDTNISVEEYYKQRKTPYEL